MAADAIRLRRLLESDQPLLWEALYLALHVPPGAAAYSKDVVRKPELAGYVDGWMQARGELGFAACDRETVVGVAWLRLWAGDWRGFGFVDETTPELSMAVWPDYRGRGVGSALLARTLEAAAERFTSVSLSVDLSNPARRLYERFGFRAIEKPTAGSVIMLKSM